MNTEKKKTGKVKKIVLGVVVVFVLFIIICCMAGGGDDAGETVENNNSAASAEEVKELVEGYCEAIKGFDLDNTGKYLASESDYWVNMNENVLNVFMDIFKEGVSNLEYTVENVEDNIHTVLHQVLTVAVEDGYMRTNISDNLLKELKQSHNTGAEHRRALTVPGQELFLDFLNKENTLYYHWKPIFTVMLYTGMRVGEITRLRWQDIDMDEDLIEVNHTLVYYNHAENGCYFSIHTPKTKAGNRTIPMLDEVKQAFLDEKRYQGELKQREFDNLQEKMNQKKYKGTTKEEY